MGWTPIRTRHEPGDESNLPDYDAAVRTFSWEQARSRLDGLPGGRGLNIAYEAADRRAAGPRGGTVALRCVTKDGSVSELTYADLARQTNRFANLLRSLGVGQAERVYTLTPEQASLAIRACWAKSRRTPTAMRCPPTPTSGTRSGWTPWTS